MKLLIEEFISFSDLERQSHSQVQGKITRIQTPHRKIPLRVSSGARIECSDVSGTLSSESDPP
ncbi:hypothetical protein PXK63_10110 [Phaeobacter gallaeciensis]|uniref:Uncharacterized protein n=2 Tax=Phaeobacter gallaeciensis TaxID=60890 RepID=A0ABD4X9J7_9RHOB|nr:MULTISPECIES: hypothetical protein [Phaeobacter]MDE4127003.1 hypothetical protein [Phaeobacter gallaeciensis]MDE4157729.1 hypothetical protein [Phaeobacter gallaeciensis]MDE4166133.1 hypothetical protein [Phaeobacter gallaeciensis]MDE4170281.1 hypothetical protein [Phaeobacter gallaeciensis]MDE4212218.1 hypothetical protein [Phaeobacter gallaeciensis]